MKKLFILFLLLTSTAPAQFVPFGAWQSADAFSPLASDSAVVWFRPDSISGKSDGDTLFALRNSAGYPIYDLIQTTDASKPTYQTNEVNGYPVIRFDGADDDLETSAARAFSTIIGGNGSSVTVYAVIRQLGTVANNTIFSMVGGNPPMFRSYATFGNVIYYDMPDASANRVSVAQPAAWDDAWQLLELYRSGDSSQIVVNDTILITKTNATGRISLSATAVFTLSAGANRFGGDVAEFIVLKAALPAARRSAYKEYLAAKYGIPIP